MRENTQKIVDMIRKLNNIQDPYWLNNTLFTWQWWVGVFITIVPWILWIVIRKKGSTNRLLFVGFFVIIVTSYFDFLGIESTFWYYEYKVVPSIPAFIPWDFSLFPISVMLLLQYRPDINPYIKAICFGVFEAFIAEPFFVVIQLYTPIAWKYIYSFPICILLYLTCHFLSKRENFKAL